MVPRVETFNSGHILTTTIGLGFFLFFFKEASWQQSNLQCKLAKQNLLKGPQSCGNPIPKQLQNFNIKRFQQNSQCVYTLCLTSSTRFNHVFNEQEIIRKSKTQNTTWIVLHLQELKSELEWTLVSNCSISKWHATPDNGTSSIARESSGSLSFSWKHFGNSSSLSASFHLEEGCFSKGSMISVDGCSKGSRIMNPT